MLLWPVLGPFEAELLLSWLMLQEQKLQSERLDPSCPGPPHFWTGFQQSKGMVARKSLRLSTKSSYVVMCVLQSLL